MGEIPYKPRVLSEDKMSYSLQENVEALALALAVSYRKGEEKAETLLFQKQILDSLSFALLAKKL